MPAPNGLVLAACATSEGKSKVISTPAFTHPILRRFKYTNRGKCNFPSRQYFPNELTVTATGANDVGGFPWTKPKPFPNSSGIRLRRLISFKSIRNLICFNACFGVTPKGTSSTITASSPSKSTPQLSSFMYIGSVAPKKLSDPP